MVSTIELPTPREVLRGSTLLNSLTEKQLSELSANSRLAFAEKGETIWLHGASVEFFGVVSTGFVKMSRSAPTGQDVTTELMGPGQVFGLLGTVDGSGCPQSAKAVTGTWYLKVRKCAFMPVYQENVILKELLLRKTSLRLRVAYDMISHLSSGKVEQRVAAVLLLLAKSYGSESEVGVTLSVPLTRQDIAEIAGTTVETTIRIMSRWQKEGLVVTESQTISIRDIDELSRAVHLAGSF